jgi:uncharacterized protein YbbC (DUF1343 family)
MFPIPMRHGMTIGEIARLFNDHFGIGAELEVIPMDGWRRDMYFDATGLTWIISSPNIPTFDTTTVYPGGVLFEGTNVSEGRGTTRPFELIGAPWVIAERFAGRHEPPGLPGVFFRPALFEPTFQKHAGQGCAGCQVHVLDRRTFQAVEAGVALIEAFRVSDSGSIRLEETALRVRVRQDAIDCLAGSAQLREQIDAGVPARDIARSWEPDVAAFLKVRDSS